LSELLLLRLLDTGSSNAPDGDWLLWDSLQRRVSARGELMAGVASEELKNYSRIAPCLVLVPGERVAQLSVTLPVAGASAEAALPYQVEEKLSCELERVHIAHEKIRAGKACKVWVVDKSCMDEWLAWLLSSGLRVRALLPDYSVLAAPVIFRDQTRTIACIGNSAASMEHALFAAWWQLQVAEPAMVLSVDNAPDSELFVDSEQQLVASQLDAAVSYFSMPANNLCQGKYQLHDVVQDTLAILRWPALAAVLVLVLHWALLGVGGLNFAQRAEQLDLAAEAVYRETFPEARRVVNARSQMKSQLNALESQRGDAGLLPLLAPVAKAFQGQSNITVSQLVFQNQTGSLRLAVEAQNYAAIDAFSSQLQGQQLQVSRGTFRQNGELISGQLIISKGVGQ
jgi:general secretion pathway protein L